jgi:hypothetical protein
VHVRGRWVHGWTTVSEPVSAHAAASAATHHRALRDHRDTASLWFAILAHEDHSSVELRVVQCPDRMLRFLGRSVLDQAAALGAATSFLQHYT